MKAQLLMNVSPVVPVIAIEESAKALQLAEALIEGGINIMEITLRTDAGLKAIELISKTFPQMHVGAGTVIDPPGMQRVIDSGGQFAFSPGISNELMVYAKCKNFTFIPGVATASEIMMALTHGFEHCKLFPATVAGGIDALKAFKGPFGSMIFCPTGGVNLANMNDFLALSNVACVGGSWIVPNDAIAANDFKRITELSREAVAKTVQRD